MSSSKKILVLGASGYVGSRLVPCLLEKGYQVRAIGRSMEKLKARPWSQHRNVELLMVNILHEQSLQRACLGCQAAYYLVHSMGSPGENFSDVDRKAADNMANIAAQEGLERIIYLGGLGDLQENLSPHLRSRAEVGSILQAGKVPTTTLRASMIIGTGSISFEILRHLVDRLPVVIIPRWVNTRSQPIAIRNVLIYLIGCLENKKTLGEGFDIGGPDILSYHRLMEVYAQEARLSKRFFVTLPGLTPQLSAYCVELLTPVPASFIRPLAEGLRNEMICKDSRIRDIIPQELIDCRKAIQLALNVQVASSSDFLKGYPPAESQYAGDPDWVGGKRFKKYASE